MYTIYYSLVADIDDHKKCSMKLVLKKIKVDRVDVDIFKNDTFYEVDAAINVAGKEELMIELLTILSKYEVYDKNVKLGLRNNLEELDII